MVCWSFDYGGVGVLGSYFKCDISREVEINRRLVLKTIGEDLL